MKNIEKNLTTGSVVRQLVAFSFPFLLSNLLQTLYSVVDMIIVGKYSGAVGISAINNGGQIINMLTNIITGLCTGATVVIGQYFGASEKKKINTVFQTTSFLLIIMGSAILVFMFFNVDNVMEWMRIPEVSYMETKKYLIITTCGIFFICGYNLFSAVMRGMGDSKNPLIFVGIACIINVFLDIVLIGVFNLGTKGAAIGTVCSQGISMFCCAFFLMKNAKLLHIKLKKENFDLREMKLVVNIGIPISVQNVIINLSFIFIAVLVNEIGVNASAAVGVVSKFNNFAIMPAVAMGASLSTIVAQIIGAKKIERVKETLYVAMVIVGSIGVIIFLISQMYTESVISLFSSDKSLLKEGIVYLKYLSIDYIFVPCLLCLNGVITGTGHAIFSSAVSIVTSVFIRVPVAYIFGKILGWGLKGVGIAAPAATVIGVIVTCLFFYSGRWKQQTSIASK